MALADMSIELFALESSVLRAEKCYGAVSPTKQQLYDAVVEVCAFDASEKFMTAAHKAMSYINNDESCYSIRKVFREARGLVFGYHKAGERNRFCCEFCIKEAHPANEYPE